MENQSKFIQNTPLLCYHHLLFKFLLHDLVRMLYPLMLLSFFLISDSSSDISDIDLLIAL